MLGQELRRIRRARRWPLTRVAEPLGVSAQLISAGERGTGAHTWAPRALDVMGASPDDRARCAVAEAVETVEDPVLPAGLLDRVAARYGVPATQVHAVLDAHGSQSVTVGRVRVWPVPDGWLVGPPARVAAIPG